MKNLVALLAMLMLTLLTVTVGAFLPDSWSFIKGLWFIVPLIFGVLTVYLLLD